MPFKYSLYRSVCIVNLVLISIFFGDIIILLIEDGGIDPESLPGLTILVIVAVIYVINNVWGLRVINHFKSKEKVTRRQRRKVLIFYFLQSIVQIFLAYTCVREIIRMARIASGDSYQEYLYTYHYDLVLPEVIPFAVCLLTIYSQILTFPLIRDARQNYLAALKSIRQLGATNV